MKRATEVPWEKIYDYVLTCGREHEPNNFVRVVLEEMSDLVPYDQGLVYCLDEHRRVEFQHLVNIKSRWSNMYLKYYSLLLGDDFNLTSDIDERFDIPYVEQITWSEAPLSEFITDYIMARGVLCTLGMVLFDQNSLPRVAFAFDRTRSSSYSDREIEIVRDRLGERFVTKKTSRCQKSLEVRRFRVSFLHTGDTAPSFAQVGPHVFRGLPRVALGIS